MIGVPPFFYEFLEHIQNGGAPEDFRPQILGGPKQPRSPAARPPSRKVRRNAKVPLPSKKKRKVSKYQKEFGKQLKLLKRKHPRTKISTLMKKAHIATRKAMK